MPPLDQLLILSLLGLIFGSFGNVLVLRDGDRLSILKDRSRCANCHKTLGVFELIPVLSWMIQGGRCRGCKHKVSAWYPLGELVGMGAGLLAAYMVPGLLIPSLLLFGALWLLGVMAAIDIRTQTVLPEYAAVVGVLGALSQTYHYSAALGAAAGAGSILLVMILWRLATGTDGMGGGDAWVAGALGLWLGWPAIVVVLVVAVFAGTFWGIGVTAYAMIRRSDTAHIALPFVPFLALGAVVAVVWGSPIITWYTSFMGIAPL